MSGRLTVIHGFPTWLPQTQTWMYNQVVCLPDTIDNHVVCERTQNLDQFDLPNIHSLSDAPAWESIRDRGLRKLRLRRHLDFLVQQAREHKAGLLHSHFGNVAWANLGAARRAGVRHVVTFYGFDVIALPRSNAVWRKRYAKLFASIDRVLCEGPHMAESIVALGCPRDKITVHHLGVRTDKIPFQPRTWDGTGPLRFLIAAAFREKKGIPYALEAVARLRDDVPVEVTIIGDADERAVNQAEKQKIMDVIERYQLGDAVNMMGFQPHEVLFEQALTHHVFLSPSVSAADGDVEGGAPVSIIEMAACGLLPVSTTHCDIPSVVLHGKTGLLAPERDVVALVQHLQWLLDNRDAWTGLLEAGRKHIESEYDAHRQGGRLATIYRDLTTSPGTT